MCMTVEITDVQDGAEEHRIAGHEYDKWLANFNFEITDNINCKAPVHRLFTNTSCRSRMSQQLLPHVR